MALSPAALLGRVRSRLAVATVVLARRIEHLLERVLGLHPWAICPRRETASACSSRSVTLDRSDEPVFVPLVRHLAAPLPVVPVVVVAAAALIVLLVLAGLVTFVAGSGCTLPSRLVGDHLAGCVQPDGLLHGGVGRGVLVRDGHEFSHVLRLCPHEFVLEHGAVLAPIGEVLDGLLLVDSLAGVAQGGPPREVLAIRLVISVDTEG